VVSNFSNLLKKIGNMALRYITLDELVSEMPVVLQGSLTDDTPNSDTKVDAILTQLGISAEEEVESYLSMRYAIPLKASDGTIPNTVKKSIFTITKYYLYGRRDQIDAGVQAQYDSAIGWLKKVADGKANVNLIDASGDVESQGSIRILVNDQNTSTFNNFV